MRQEAYQELRRLILSGELDAGERLRDHEIARWLSVSRTPVREALTRLVDDGLVEMAPNRYTRVRPIDPRDVAGYPVAAALHGLVALHAAASPALGDALDSLSEAAERYAWARLREDGPELIAADDELHAILAQVAGNPVLEEELSRLGPRLRRLELAAGQELAAVRPDGHGLLLDALAAGDGDAARSLAERELTELAARVESVLRRGGPAAP